MQILAHMTDQERAALTTDELIDLFIDNNFDRSKMARGQLVNLSGDLRDCLRAERERAALIAEETTRAPMNYIGWSPGLAADDRARIIARLIRS